MRQASKYTGHAQMYSALAVLLLVNVWLSSAGYRLSADDILFHFKALGGLREAWKYVIATATSEGRIGSFILIPINMWGALLSEYVVGRYLIGSLYFSTFILFAFFLSLILRRSGTVWLSAIFLAFHPLLYQHTPPTAYPLQSSIPFLVLLGSRVYLLVKGESWLVRICMFFALLASEYAFLFGTALLFIEYILSGSSDRSSIKSIWSSRCLRRDVAAVASALAIYLLWRWAYPSKYTGNSIVGILSVKRTIHTLVNQTYYGTIIPYVEFKGISETAIAGAILIALITATLAYRTPEPVGETRYNAAAIAVFGLALVYVMLPLAVSTQFQTWCLERGECAYVSSRSGFYFLVPLISLSALSVVPRRFHQIFFTVSVSAAAFFGFAHNWKTAASMREYVSPYLSAKWLACTPDSANATLIVPSGKMAMHSTFNKTEYWRRYMASVRGDCP
jgi:hypothetical protein